MDALQPGQVLGSFRIVRPLGAGGMGTVYEAEHLRLPVRRALKVFSSESIHTTFLRKRFLAEGKILSSLQHPRIVRVYDLIVDDETGLAYFEMDLVCSPDGEPQTLAQAHERGVGEDEIKTWFEDVCEGLAYIHSKGVIHRDISADNILIGPDGRAVISDFGIAKIVDEEYRKKIDVTVTMVTPNGVEFRMGKERYMSPELKAKNGKASFASDAWALGVTFFWLLSGSWYDVGTRLEDSLAIFDYDWATVIAQLCNKNQTKRQPEGGMGDVSKLLRKRAAAAPFWQRKWVQIAGVVVVLLTALLVVSLNKADDAKKQPVKPPRTTAEILKGAESGNVEDMVLAADLYRDGISVSTNYERSAELYRKAIEAGSFDAVAGLGALYETGRGVTNNPRSAFLLYLIAAGNGASNAYDDVIRCYEKGVGVALDETQAKNWKQRKALKPLEKKRQELLDALDGTDDDPIGLGNRGNDGDVRHARMGGLDWTYCVESDGTAAIVGKEENGRWVPAVGVDTSGALDIPAEIEGHKVGRIGPRSFCDCVNLVSVTVPDTVKRLESRSFMGCTRLERVLFKEGLCEIGDRVFSCCVRLTPVELPHSVTNIGVSAFLPTHPQVPDDHSRFAYVSDGLYSRDYTELIGYYGTNTVGTVDARTRRIGRGAFDSCSKMKVIEVPEGVTNVGNFAFHRCSSLETVVLPATLSTIGSRVFCCCWRLLAVHYRGREPHAAEDAYGLHKDMLSLVVRGKGWENSEGELPRFWPRVSENADLVGDARSRGVRQCWCVRYWDGKRAMPLDEVDRLRTEALMREAQHGNVAACEALAWMYEHGIHGAKKDVSKAIDYLQGAVAAGGGSGIMYKIGDFYRKGSMGKKNYTEAFRWYARSLEYPDDAAEWDRMRACQELAGSYRRGLGVEKDESFALDLFLIAGAHGMPGAQCVLSDCYEKGLGVSTNQVLAKKWLERAKASNRDGHELGLWYQHGGGVVDPDVKKATIWYQEGVGHGNGASAGALASCFKDGRGVARDPDKAFSLYRKSAEAGWSFGMTGVGECYEKGIGTPTNLVEAAKWYIRAAEVDRDYWDGGSALIKAGDCYANGMGVKKDYAKAKEWYEKAVVRRHSETARLRILALENKRRNEQRRQKSPTEQEKEQTEWRGWCRKVESILPREVCEKLATCYAGSGGRNSVRYLDKMGTIAKFGHEVAVDVFRFTGKNACTKAMSKIGDAVQKSHVSNTEMPWRDAFKGDVDMSVGDDGVSLLIISSSRTMTKVRELVLRQEEVIR